MRGQYGLGQSCLHKTFPIGDSMNEKDKMDAALDRIFAYGVSKKDMEAKKSKPKVVKQKDPLKSGPEKTK